MMYLPQIIAAPTEYPVTEAMAKKHCRIDIDDDDELVNGWIQAATGYLQNRLGRSLISQGLRIYLDYFEQTVLTGPQYGFPYIALPWAPLISVQSLTYTDSTGVAITWTGSGGNLLLGSPGVVMAHVDAATQPGRLVVPYGTFLWPTISLRSANAIQIDYTAGYTDAESVPVPIKQAIYLMCSHWNKNREAVVLGKSVAVDSKPLIMAVDALVDPYKIEAY